LSKSIGMSCSEMAKKGKRPGDRSCSQNAHDEAVLAWVKGASLRARGGWVRSCAQ
jgi:hypothetical protein